MKAMLEARMVAASTQRPLDFEHGAAAGRDRITFSSQGSRKRAHIFAAYQKAAAFAEATASEGGQRTEDRRQKTEDRGQRTEIRGQRTEDRGQRVAGEIADRLSCVSLNLFDSMNPVAFGK